MIGAVGRGLRNNEQTSVDVCIFISKSKLCLMIRSKATCNGYQF